MTRRLLQHPVTRNSLTLIFVQALSYIAPLATLPYLTRTLGVNEYGALASAVSFTQICALILDYGLTLYITPKISIKRDDRFAISKLLGSIITIKFTIFGIITLGLSVTPSTYWPTQIQPNIAWIALASAFSIAMQPYWLFQGIERTRPIAYCLISTQLTYLILVFSWVKSPNDLTLALSAQFLAQVLSLCIAWKLALSEGYRVTQTSLYLTYNVAKESFPFFLSRLSISSYTNAGALIVGSTCAPAVVASYFLAEQIFKALQSLIFPVIQSLYSNLSKTQNIQLLWRVALGVCCLTWLGCTLFFILSTEITRLIGGAEFFGSGTPLRLFMIALALSAPSLFLGYPLTTALGWPTNANFGVIITGILHITLLSILWILDLITPTSIASSAVFAEAILLSIRGMNALIYWRQHISRKLQTQ